MVIYRGGQVRSQGNSVIQRTQQTAHFKLYEIESKIVAMSPPVQQALRELRCLADAAVLLQSVKASCSTSSSAPSSVSSSAPGIHLAAGIGAFCARVAQAGSPTSSGAGTSASAGSSVGDGTRSPAPSECLVLLNTCRDALMALQAQVGADDRTGGAPGLVSSTLQTLLRTASPSVPNFDKALQLTSAIVTVRSSSEVLQHSSC